MRVKIEITGTDIPTMGFDWTLDYEQYKHLIGLLCGFAAAYGKQIDTPPNTGDPYLAYKTNPPQIR